MRIAIHVIWVCWLPGLSAYGQPRQLTGNVRDQATQRPVELAHITLHSLPDSLIVNFARTNTSGFFSLTHTPEPGQPYFLKVSHVSYGVAFSPLSTESWATPIDIQLRPGQLTLREVRVTAPISVREQGDSTRYRVDAFQNGSERNLEDVLKKMPNIRVEENGDIYFKNRRVEKVLIDGDDLVGNTYQLATRSINPALVNEVQAIENFSENQLLRRIEQSDKTVLNLTVKDDWKSTLFGLIDAGAGPQRHNVIGNLFSYSKHVKALSVLSANNVGTRRLELSDGVATVLADDRPASELLVIPFTQTARPFVRNLNSPLENLNRERVGTVNAAVNPVKNLKITANLSLLRDRIEAGRLQMYQLIGDARLRYQQADTLRQRPALAHLRVQLNYGLSARTALVYIGTAGTKTIDLRQMTQFTTAGTASRFPQQFGNRIHDRRHVLELTHKLNARQALVVSAQATDTRLTERYDARLNPALATVAFGDTLFNTNRFGQVVSQHNRLYGGQLRWLYGTKTRKFEQQIGFLINQFRADLWQQDGGFPPGSDGLVLNRRTTYSRTSGKLSWPAFELTGVLHISHVAGRIDRQADRRSPVQATLAGSFRLSALSRLVLAYERQATPVSNTYLIDQTVITDFRSAQRGYRGLLFDKRDQASLSYLYTDVALRRMTFLVTTFATRSNNFWNLADLRFSPDYSATGLINTPDVYTLGVTSTFEKLIYPILGNVRLMATVFQNQARQFVNGQPRRTVGFMPTVTARYVSVFESPFNLEVSGTYRHTTLTALENERSFRQQFSVFNGYTQFFYRQRKYQVSTTVEANRIQKTNYLFLKATAAYQVTPVLSVRAEAMNLLNQTTYRQVTLTPTTYSAGTYPLLPRMTLLHIRYSF